MRAHGIDISAWQPPELTSFERVAAGTVNGQPLDFAIVKVSDGTGSTSKAWREQHKRLRDTRIPILGGYHYIQFESKPGVSIEDDARAEVRRHCDVTFEALGHVLGSQVGELPMMLDAEDLTGHLRTGEEIGDWLAYAKDESERISGCTPLLYTGFGGFWGKYPSLARRSELAEMPLVVAAYPRTLNVDTSSPRFFAPWDTWSCWQYAGDPKANGFASWPGIPGACDRNVWRDPSELYRLAGLPLPDRFRAGNA